MTFFCSAVSGSIFSLTTPSPRAMLPSYTEHSRCHMSLDQDTITQQLALLATHRRTLAHLVAQATQYGGEVFAPPQTAAGIAETRAAIGHIKTYLREEGIAVEDAPNDDALPHPINIRYGSSPSMLG